MKIHAIDLALIIGYFLLVLYIAFRVSRSVHDSGDYFLAGRKLKWPLIGASLFATNISAEQFVGQAGLAFVIGISVANYQLAGVWAFIIMGIFFLPLFLRLGLMTTSQYFEVRYGIESRRFLSLLNILSISLNVIPVSLYAGGTVMMDLFGFSSIIPGILIIGLTAGTYAFLGGLRAVVITDFIQVIFLLLGGVLVLYIGLDRLGGWDNLMTQLATGEDAASNGFMSLIQPVNHGWVPWTGVVLGLSMHALFFCSMNHDLVQRALGARSIQQARLGGLLAGFLKVGAVFIIVVPGLIGFVLHREGLLGPELSSPDQLFPAMIRSLLPVGITGLVLAGLIAALMSSIDSHICATASLVTIDWVKPRRPDASEASLVLSGRVVGIIVLLLGFAWAIFVVPQYKFLFDYFAKFVSYAVGGVLACFIWGMISPIPGRRACFITMVVGTGAGLFLWLANDNPIIAKWVCSDEGLGLAVLRMHFLHASFALFAFSSTLLFLLTFIFREDGRAGYAATRENPNNELQPTAREDRVFWIATGLLVVLTVAVYLYFS